MGAQTLEGDPVRPLSILSSLEELEDDGPLTYPVVLFLFVTPADHKAIRRLLRSRRVDHRTVTGPEAVNLLWGYW